MRLHILYAGGTSHTVGNPAPCHAPHAAKIGLTGFPAPRTPRATPRPYRAAHAANSLYWPSGPTGGGQFAGNPAPCPAAHAAKIGLTGFPAPRIPRETPHPAAPRTFHFSNLFAVGFMWRCGIFYVAGGSLTLPYRFRREDAAHEWGRRRHGNVHRAARSAFYGKVSLSFVGEDHWSSRGPGGGGRFAGNPAPRRGRCVFCGANKMALLPEGGW